MPSELLKKLHEQRTRVATEMRAIADKPEGENGTLSAEQDSAWRKATAELDSYDTRMKDVSEGEKRAKANADAFAELEGKETDEGKRTNDEGNESKRSGLGSKDKEKREEALRAFFLSDKSHDRIDIPYNKRSILDACDNAGMSLAEKRTLTVGTATAGGDTVPTAFYDRLVEHLIQVSAILQTHPTVLNTASGEPLQIPKTTAHPTASLTTEGGTLGGTDPAFGQLTLGSYKYSVMIQLSRELITDSGVDLEGYLARACGRALGNKIGADLVVGNGSGAPQGIVPVASAGVTGATSVVGVPNADNLIDLMYSVIPQYRNSPSCMWMMADTTIATIRKFKDGEGRYLWQPSLQIGVPDTLLGKVLVTDPNVAATALSAKSVIFGDFSTYFVRFVGGARFERSDEFAFDEDLVTFRALMRADGNLVDRTGAVKVFTGGAS